MGRFYEVLQIGSLRGSEKDLRALEGLFPGEGGRIVENAFPILLYGAKGVVGGMLKM